MINEEGPFVAEYDTAVIPSAEIRTRKDIPLPPAYPEDIRISPNMFSEIPIDRDTRDTLYHHAFSTSKADWRKIRESGIDKKYIRTTSTTTSDGNCEDYVREKHPSIPEKPLTNSSFLTHSAINPNSIDPKKEYVIVYWRKENEIIRDAEPNRRVAVHIGILSGGLVRSKFSFRGGEIQHRKNMVPTNFGSWYTVHKIP